MNSHRIGSGVASVSRLPVSAHWRSAVQAGLAFGLFLACGSLPLVRATCSNDDVVVLEPYEVTTEAWTEADEAAYQEFIMSDFGGNEPDLDLGIDWNDPMYDTGSGSSGEAGADSDTCEGANPFTVYDGNVSRKIDDLAVSRRGDRLGLPWVRYHNTVNRRGAEPFGFGGDWRHGWQYDLFELPQWARSRRCGWFTPTARAGCSLPMAKGAGSTRSAMAIGYANIDAIEPYALLYLEASTRGMLDRVPVHVGSAGYTQGDYLGADGVCRDIVEGSLY